MGNSYIMTKMMYDGKKHILWQRWCILSKI